MPPLFGSGRPRRKADPEAFLARVRGLAASRALPPRRELSKDIEAAVAALEAEDESLRPRDSSGRPGGLLLLPPSPTVVMPDIHARPAFLAAALAWKPPLGRPWSGSPEAGEGPTLAALLAAGEASLVLVGDLFHSETGGAYERWLRAYREYASRWRSRAAMDEEMARSLAVARIVLEAKAAFPRNFHCLKGNHDNATDEEGRGDHSFYKFAEEGAMVASWLAETYGTRLRSRYRDFELDLPLVALGRCFAASHAEPAFALSREDVVEYRSRPEVVEALIWTPNDGAVPGSVSWSLEALMGEAPSVESLWFSGHRPVEDRYALRAGGRLVQFHNPGARRVLLLAPDRPPDPDRDLRDLPALD